MQIVVLDAKTLRPGELDLSRLRALGPLSLYDRTDPALVPQRLRGADVVLTNKVKLDGAMLAAASNLKMVGVLATGFDVVDVAAAKQLGIPVCNVPGYATDSVAQSVFGFLLEMTCHTAYHNARIHQGAWTACPEFCWWERNPVALSGKTLGIIGCGAIGRKVGEIGKAFGMKVLGCTPHEKPGFAGKYVKLEELLKQADVLSLHCPAKKDNLGMVDEAFLGQMKPGALLINTARGALINELAVQAALVSGQLGGYGADVVGQEPISVHNPLLKAPNCYLSGHSAWATLEGRQKIIDITAANIESVLAGKPQNLVY